MTERQGVEIDYCSKFHSVWFDKGDLDKIVEKSSSAHASQEQKQYDEKRKRNNDDDDEVGFFSRGRQGNNQGHRRGSSPLVIYLTLDK